MIACATNGECDFGSGSTHDFQQPSSISAIMALLRWISPSRKVFIPGIKPGFLTMYYLSTSALFQTRSTHTHSHQLGWIASYRIELKASLLHKLFEDAMRGQSNSMAVPLQLSAQGDEWLHITTTANDLNNNIQRNIPLNSSGGRIWAFDRYETFFNRCGNKSTKGSGKLGAKLYVDASICGF